MIITNQEKGVNAARLTSHAYLKGGEKKERKKSGENKIGIQLTK